MIDLAHVVGWPVEEIVLGLAPFLGAILVALGINLRRGDAAGRRVWRRSM